MASPSKFRGKVAYAGPLLIGPGFGLAALVAPTIVNRVERSLGYGLDDEAKKVLKRWKCNPGKVNGQPVAVQLQIVINFHLY